MRLTILMLIFGLFGLFNAQKRLNNKLPERTKLTVTIILPNDAFRLRDFNACIGNEVKAINNMNYPFMKHFYLDNFTILMQRNYNQILKALCDLLRTNTTTALIINYMDYSKIDALNSKFFIKFASQFNIPVLTFIPNAYQTDHMRANEIQMSPTLYHQAAAIMGLLSRYEWFKYSIILSDAFGSDEFLKAADSLKAMDVKKQFEIQSIIKLKIKKGEKSNRKELLRRFRSIKLETRVFLLHCNYDEAEDILSVADEMGMTTYEYMWIFTRSAIEDKFYTNVHHRHFPIGSLAVWYNTSAEWSCKSVISDSLKTWAGAVDRYFTLNKDSDNLTKILPDTKCWKDSKGKTTYEYGKTFHEFLLQTSANKTQNRSLRFTPNGILESVDLTILNLNTKYEWNPVGRWIDRKIMMDDIVWPGKAHKPPIGRPTRFHLKIVTLEEPPFVIYKFPLPDGKCLQNSVLVRLLEKKSFANSTANATKTYFYKCASGFYIDLLIILKDRLEFTFDMYQVEDGNWGANLGGSWNGLIGDLISGEADMVMTSLKVTNERSQVIDFSVPFMETGIAIVVALRPGAISTTAFLKPYDYIIWIMILLVILHSVAISVYLFEWIRDKLTGTPYHHQFFTLVKVPKENKFTFGHSLWLIWVLLFRAAAEVVQPTGFTSKFMSNIWALFCMAFMASYTANLAAFMITKEEYHDLKGVEDERLTNPMKHNPALRFGTVKHGSTEEVIKKNIPGMYKYMEKYMENNISAGVEAVKNNTLDAFMYDAVVLDYRSGQDNNCKLRVVGSWYSMTGYGIAFPKGSRFKEMIDRKILEYSHSGELERSQRFWFSGVCKNQVEDNGRGSHSLEIPNFTSAFILLAAGILLATILLVLNHFYHAFFHKKVEQIWVYKSTKDKTHRISSVPSIDGQYNILKNSTSSRSTINEHHKNGSKCVNLECCKRIEKLENELKSLTKLCNYHNGNLMDQKKIKTEVKHENEAPIKQNGHQRPRPQLPQDKLDKINELKHQFDLFNKKRLELETVL